MHSTKGGTSHGSVDLGTRSASSVAKPGQARHKPTGLYTCTRPTGYFKALKKKSSESGERKCSMCLLSFDILCGF